MAKTRAVPSGSQQVEEYIQNSQHPLKQVVAAARAAILNAGPELTEHIKWNAPSFCHLGQDRVTFNLHNQNYLLLVFHRGAKASHDWAERPALEDDRGLLEWVTNDRASLKLHSLEELEAKRERLQAIVRQWVALTAQ
jgi:hypothetical protein